MAADKCIPHACGVDWHLHFFGIMCNPLCLVGRRDSETPDTIDIDGEDTITSFGADVGRMSS